MFILIRFFEKDWKEIEEEDAWYEKSGFYGKNKKRMWKN